MKYANLYVCPSALALNGRPIHPRNIAQLNTLADIPGIKMILPYRGMDHPTRQNWRKSVTLYEWQFALHCFGLRVPVRAKLFGRPYGTSDLLVIAFDEAMGYAKPRPWAFVTAQGHDPATEVQSARHLVQILPSAGITDLKLEEIYHALTIP